MLKKSEDYKGIAIWIGLPLVPIFILSVLGLLVWFLVNYILDVNPDIVIQFVRLL